MKPFLLNLVFLLILSGNILAQVQEQPTKEKQPEIEYEEDFKRPNSLEGKFLLLDHYTPADSFALDGFGNMGNGFEIAYHRHINNFLTVGVPLKFSVAKIPGSQFDNRITLSSVDAVLRLRYFNKDRVVVPYVFGGIGAVKETEQDVYIQAPIGAGINLKVIPWGYISLQAEYRLGVSGELERNNIQYGIGFLYMLGKPIPKEAEDNPKDLLGGDRDMDGIPDVDDDCPDDAGVVAFNGCPDTDNDGIQDVEDACPEIAGLIELLGCPDADKDGFADKDDECPEEAGPVNGCPDFDGDGVADKDDACPEQAGNPEKDGCPEAEGGSTDNNNGNTNNDGTDSDGDGFADAEDECPNEVGPVNGCPDRDSDGVPDKDDRCPDLAGTATDDGCPDSDGDRLPDHLDLCPDEVGPRSNQGCPEMNEAEQDVLVEATQAVRFRTGSASLKSASYPVLDEIVTILERYPHYNLKISGHTDNTGGTRQNLKLSELRAKACLTYIKDQGISDLRLSFIGYGEERPVSSNDSDEGRRLNRRTEFDMFLRPMGDR